MGLFDNLLSQNGWLGLSPADAQASQEARDAAYGFQRGTGQRMQNPNDRSSWIADALGSLPWRDMLTFQGPQEAQAPASVHPAYARLADAFGGGQLPPSAPQQFNPQPAPQQPPQSFNMPMPLPRPAPGVNLGMPSAQQQPPAPQAPQPVQPPPAPPPQASPQVQAPQPGPGIGDRFSASAQGFFNARSPMQAIGNLIGGAATGNRMDLDPMDMGTDPNTGRKMFGVYDPGSQAIKPLGGGGFGGQPGENNGFLAPGVQYVNSAATGDAYLKQWSPEVQAAAKAYLAGHIVPSGNPRDRVLASKAKEVAMKYAADNGIEFSDAKFSEMRKFRTELGSTSPNTVGGQAKAFGQGIEHMEALGKTDLAMNNSSGFGIPKLAEWANGLRQATSTEQAALAAKAQGIGQTLAGEVGKLFSGTAGGGVEERRQTRERFNSVKSPQELAAALEATLETMHGGLTALENHRSRVFSGNPPPDTELVNAGTKEKIKSVENIIAQLRGGTSAAGWSVKKL